MNLFANRPRKFTPAFAASRPSSYIGRADYRTMRTLSLFLLVVLLFSCSDEKEDFELDMGHDYFPLEIGQNRYYEADSLTFRPAPAGIQVDSQHYFIREEVVDTFRDAGDELRYRIHRYERASEALPWRLRKALAASRTDRQAILLEDNLPFVKLIFPLRTGQSWDGNRLFADEDLRLRVAGEVLEVFKEWHSEAVEVGSPSNAGSQIYDDVATVLHANFETVVDIRRVEERYARGVGLVYREMLILDSQCQACCGGDTGFCQSLSWRERAEAGFILRQWLTHVE